MKTCKSVPVFHVSEEQSHCRKSKSGALDKLISPMVKRTASWVSTLDAASASLVEAAMARDLLSLHLEVRRWRARHALQTLPLRGIALVVCLSVTVAFEMATLKPFSLAFGMLAMAFLAQIIFMVAWKVSSLTVYQPEPEFSEDRDPPIRPRLDSNASTILPDSDIEASSIQEIVSFRSSPNLSYTQALAERTPSPATSAALLSIANCTWSMFWFIWGSLVCYRACCFDATPCAMFVICGVSWLCFRRTARERDRHDLDEVVRGAAAGILLKRKNVGYPDSPFSADVKSGVHIRAPRFPLRSPSVRFDGI